MYDLNKLSDAQLERLANRLALYEFLLEGKNMTRLTAPRVPVGKSTCEVAPVPREELTPAESKLRAADSKKTKLSFLRGWRHHLWQLPYPRGYEGLPAVQAVPYESGRHAAALYEQERRAKGLSINGVMSYAEARRVMGVDLRRMIDAERKWCAVKLKRSLAQRLTSKG